jgi:hypothetical protein
MGDRLVKYYEQAKALGDLKAQMRLAVLSKMSIQKAESEPDSPENVAIFEKAMQELKKEF